MSPLTLLGSNSLIVSFSSSAHRCQHLFHNIPAIVFVNFFVKSITRPPAWNQNQEFGPYKVSCSHLNVLQRAFFFSKDIYAVVLYQTGRVIQWKGGSNKNDANVQRCRCFILVSIVSKPELAHCGTIYLSVKGQFLTWDRNCPWATDNSKMADRLLYTHASC